MPALVEQLAGDVLEGDHVAVAVGRDLDRKRQQIAALRIMDHAAALAARDKLRQLRGDIRQRRTDRIGCDIAFTPAAATSRNMLSSVDCVTPSYVPGLIRAL